MNEKRSVAGKTYEPSDYKGNSQLEVGLAMTHEQASDTLTEGTIDGNIDNLQDDSTAIPRKEE